MDDDRDLQRFVEAQRGCYDEVLAELRQGRKRTHWMWFVFPQLEGLGHSATARHFALRDMREARAYAAHALLGARLRECVALSLAIEPAEASAVFGTPDDLKLRSCLTLFDHAVPDEPLFRDALEHWFEGQRDPRTLALLGEQAP